MVCNQSKNEAHHGSDGAERKCGDGPVWGSLRSRREHRRRVFIAASRELPTLGKLGKRLPVCSCNQRGGAQWPRKAAFGGWAGSARASFSFGQFGGTRMREGCEREGSFFLGFAGAVWAEPKTIA